jgi:hypothetical protein
MKTAISIPDDVFREVERATKKLGISRSELFTRAVREFLFTQRSDAIKQSYDEAFGPAPEDDSTPLRREAARRVLRGVKW